MPENKRPLRILVTNDDGIDAPTLLSLVGTAVKFGEVTVAAPAAQCSAMSQRLTLFEEIPAEEVDYPVPGVKAWKIGGTPADCIKLAAWSLVPEKPDIVFSGMNRGYNTGYDIAYSGTIGACKEAAIKGIPCPLSEFKGIIRNTKIAPTPLYADEYSTESVPGGPLRFKAHGRALRPDEAPEGTDVWTVLNGYISVGIVRSEVFPEDCQ